MSSPTTAGRRIQKEGRSRSPGAAPGSRRRPAPETLLALVTGDVPALVEAMAASLPEAGYRATTATQLMQVAEMATGGANGSRRVRFDLIIFVLSREAWTFISLIEVLVHEIHPVPIVVFTEGATRYGQRLEALGVPVVEHLPFETEGGGVPLTPASSGAAWGRRAGRPRAPTSARRGRGLVLPDEDRTSWTPVPAGAFSGPGPGAGGR